MSPDVLNAILTAPWVQEKLESMSGGATVRTLPISALRSLSIPIPSREAADRAAQDLADVDELRTRVADLVRNIDETRRAIWHSLWHIVARQKRSPVIFARFANNYVNNTSQRYEPKIRANDTSQQYRPK